MHHEQDMRKMGGLRSKLPYTWALMLIGTLALTGVGIPHLAGFSGFYSKDTIIEAAHAAHTPGDYAFWALVIAAFMTSFYSWRLMFMTFHGPTRADKKTFKHAHESPPVMLVPLAVLALGAVVAGVATPFFVGEGQAEFWGKAIFNGEHNHILHALHEVPNWVPWAPTIAMAAGFVIAYLYYIAVPSLPSLTARVFRPLYLFFLNKWYFDELYDWLFVRPAFVVGRGFWKGGDGQLIDGLGPDGVAATALRIARGATRLQTGYIFHYAFAMLIGVLILVSWYLLRVG
jgi:NADH-quinone oxidoreductase subunit L